MTGTSTFAVAPDGVQGVLVACYDGAEVVALVLLCLAVAAAAATADLPAIARRFHSLARTVGAVQGLAAALGLVAAAVGVDAVPPEVTPVLLLLFVAGFAVGLWLLAAVWSLRSSPPWAPVESRASSR